MAKKNPTLLQASLDRQWNQALSARKDFDWKWFLYDLWVAGKHYARWDTDTQQIVTDNRDRGSPKIAINFIHSTLRSVANFAASAKPRAEVIPDNLSADNVDDAVVNNKYLDFLHDKLKLSIKLRGSVWAALKYSVGYWQILWDEDDQEIAVYEIDPYDLYWDSSARDPSEARYVVLAVRRHLEDLQNDSKYDKQAVARLKADNKLASSSLKERLLTLDKKGGQSNDDSKDKGTVIVREHWYRRYDKTGKPSIWIAATAGGQIIRQPEKTDLSRFPFFRLRSDIEPLSMYGSGWVRDLIPINKQLNRLESQLAEYNDLMNKGKWVADKNAGVRIINNENGQIIEKKRGFEVSQVPIVPLSSGLFNQIATMKRYLEELGAAQDALLGRIPTGAKSGKAIEALQQGNANSLIGFQMNIEDFLDECYEYMLTLAAQKYQFARTITPVRYTTEREFLKVIGEGAENKPDDATVIKAKNIVRVRISSWMLQSSEARKQSILELAQVIPDLPEDVILQAFEIGNISDIVAGIRKRREERLEEEALKAQMGQEARPGAQAATAAIEAIIGGQRPNVTGMVDAEFIAYLDQFLASPEAQDLPPETLQAIQNLRSQAAQGALVEA